MSDRIGRAVRLALQPFHIPGRARSLRRLGTRVIDALVVLSLLVPTIPTAAAGAAEHPAVTQATGSASASQDSTARPARFPRDDLRPPASPSLQLPPDLIFADGFESGNFSAWSSSTIDGGDLSVTTQAAIAGTYGMQALLDDNNSIYVTDLTPAAAKRYRSRFYFDPNSIPMASGDAHFLLYGLQGTSTVILRVEMRSYQGDYQLRFSSLLDNGTTWTYSGWNVIRDQMHYLELDWQAATAAGANNGTLTFWIDGLQKTPVTGLDTDQRMVDLVRLGAVAGVDTGTRGTYYFDAFESRSETYIGPDPNSPSPPAPPTPPEMIFADAFETGNFVGWSANTTDGGNLSVSTAAALVGVYGLQAVINDNNAIYVTDWSPFDEGSYLARFYFDPNSITMAAGNAHYILYGYRGDTTTVVVRVELQFASGAYQIRAGAANDAGTFTNTSWGTISDAPHYLEIQWSKAAQAGSNDGFVKLQIDGLLVGQTPGIDNDTQRVDYVRLGAIAGIDTGTRGTYYFDAFLSRRYTAYIGPVGAVPQQTGASRLLPDDHYPSLFTGQLRYAYPLWTPPGRAGMAPSLTLSYASGVLDGWIGDVQAPWIGAGWSVDAAEIVRTITTSETQYGYADTYGLTFNGVRYDLVADGTTPGRYRAQEESFLYVQRHNLALGNAGAVANATKEWWEVVARDGTRYHLGWDPGSEQRAFMAGYSCTVGSPCTTPNAPYATMGYAGVGTGVVGMRWRLDKILDRHGNFASYSYTEETKTVSGATFDRASYLSSIRYSGHQDGGGTVDLQPGYEVRFVLAPRTGDYPTSGLSLWETVDSQLLDRVDICYGTCATGTVVRNYDLGYEVMPAGTTSGTLTLTGIIASSAGFSESGQTVAAATAPTVKFTYQLLGNMDPGCGGCMQIGYPRLTRIDNGYGGSFEYAYEADGRSPAYPYAYRVREVVTRDGFGIAADRKMTYASPAYEGGGTGALIGYQTVSDTAYQTDTSTPILETRHTYGSSDPDIGHELSTESKNGSGTSLRRTAYTWTTDNAGLPPGVTFRYVQRDERFERSGGALVRIAQGVYTRDPATGNLTRQQDYQDASLYRTIDLTYNVNADPAVWILDRLSVQTLKDSGGALKGEQRFYFDGSLTAPPTVGDLTLMQARTGSGNQTVDTTYAYDLYGNLLQARAYKAYGTAGTSPSGSYQSTAVTYDTTVHTYAATVTNALSQTSTLATLFTLGVPYRFTDPNNLVTTTTFDGLSRTRSTWAPGFASPTVKTFYPSPDAQGQVQAPNSVDTQVWDTLGPGGPSYRSTWTISDGLGRAIQSQALDGSGQLYVKEVGFNAQSLADRQSVPRTMSGAGGVHHAPSWGSILHVKTTYDPLGRPLEVEQPGGETTAYAYDRLTTSTTDANEHRISREYDAFGRQIEVQEFSGEDPNFSLYASTAYVHDVADRLTRITDAQGHQTNMLYDWLGRKTSMDDPNAGDLTYTYDPLGNLLTQTDARGCLATLTYDDLNRLTGRTYTGAGACATTPSVSVSYDATAGGNLGIGRRTGMTDASGSTSWLHTNSARTVQETRTVSGAPAPYQITTESDWMGRPDMLTFPDGEDVAYTYDALGRSAEMDSTIAGSLAALDYTDHGQLSKTTLGNGVLLQNCYRSDDLRLESRRAYPGTAQACSVAHPAGAAIDFSYAYDSVGNITSLEDTVQAESFTYSYDFLNRLVEAGGIDLTSFVFREQRSYNELGVVTQLSEWNGLRAGTGSYEETYSGFWSLGSWNTVSDPAASGGAYVQSPETGARIRLAFTGGGFNYVRTTGPDQGIAEIYLDGQLLSDADNYSSAPVQQASTSYGALPAGNHRVEVRVSGRKNAASTGVTVALDALAILEGGPQASSGGGRLSALAPSVALQADESPTPSATPTPGPSGTETPVDTATPEATPTLSLATPTPTGELSTPTPTPSATPGPTEVNPFLLTPTAVPKELLEQGPRGEELEAGLEQTGCSNGQCVIEILAGSDDAGTNPGSCTGSVSAPEIYFGQCQNGQDIISGFRFTAAEIPQGADIQEAHLEFTVDGEYSVDLTLSLHGEASDNAATFNPGGPPLPPTPGPPTTPDLPSNRPLGEASAAWHIPSSEVWVVGHEHSSPDISTVVQEIVDRPGWVSGNALAIIVKNAGTSSPPNLHRRVMAFERGGMQPGWHFARLVVVFSTTPPPGYDPQPVIPDPDHPHAVSQVQRPGGTDTYSYDDTGNMSARTEAAATYAQTTNAEGRLVRVEKTGSGEVWTFTYDGDGTQIKRGNPDGTSTLYLAGGLYEVSLDASGQQTGVRRYYVLAGQRVAMRDTSGTSYLLSDHIGSVVAVLDETGAVVAEQRYKPFGQPRLTPGIAQTDVGFTGQRSLAPAGLQDFNARWLDSSLGMFAAPDSLIANPYNPQLLNPYGYVMNNPLRYTDPTGLYVFEEAPTDKYVSVSDPRVRYASKTPQSKPLAPAPRPAAAPQPAPSRTGGVTPGEWQSTRDPGFELTYVPELIHAEINGTEQLVGVPSRPQNPPNWTGVVLYSVVFVIGSGAAVGGAVLAATDPLHAPTFLLLATAGGLAAFFGAVGIGESLGEARPHWWPPYLVP